MDEYKKGEKVVVKLYDVSEKEYVYLDAIILQQFTHNQTYVEFDDGSYSLVFNSQIL